jgi:ubiquinone/menaquinone biosynthesis C-methylase UbiE
VATVEHPRFARLYLKFAAQADARGGAEHRDRLLANVAGTVVEVGAGHGGNFSHYPSSVERVVAVEPEPTLRAEAERAAREAPVPVEVVDGLADAIPLADDSADVAVCSLVLCTVPDQERALREIARVLKPGGELRFYEHVVARRQPLRAGLQLADRSTLWPRIAGGCHGSRDTAAAIAAAGYEIERCERFGFRAGALMPPIPHIIGLARAPA